MQASHATFQCGKFFPRCRDPSEVDNLIVIGVPDEEHLLDAHRYVESLGIKAVLFREPDMGDQATALCTEAMGREQKRNFRRFKLWKEETCLR